MEDEMQGERMSLTDFLVLRQFVRVIAAGETVQGTIGLIYFGILKKFYPTIGQYKNPPCIPKNVTTPAPDGSFENVLLNMMNTDEFMIFNSILFLIAGLGLFYVDYKENYNKLKKWMVYYILHCIPNFVWCVLTITAIITLKERKEKEADAVDVTVTALPMKKECQDLTMFSVFTWNVLLAYYLITICCYMDKLKKKLLSASNDAKIGFATEKTETV